MSLLTAEAILAADDLQTETVDVPEWGGTVAVRVMTGDERQSFEEAMLAADDDGRNVMPQFRSRLAALTLVDDKGKRLFSDEQVGKLGAKSAAALDRVVDVASRLNRLTAQDVQDLAGNSDAGPDAGSSSS
jgi:hypothetical protein